MILFIIRISIIVNNMKVIKTLVDKGCESFIIINVDFVRKNEIKIFKIKLQIIVGVFKEIDQLIMKKIVVFYFIMIRKRGKE